MSERYKWKAAKVAAFLFIFVASVSVTHASMSVSPVRIDLSDEHRKDVIRVSNQDESAKSYEVNVVAWSQSRERREIYTPTEDLLAVPPLFTLQPGEEQIVRIGMLQDADAATERSYRMFVTELAPPQPESPAATGITMRVQIGVPVFVAPTALPTATLDYVDSMQVEEQLFMQFRNSGNTHVKVTEVQFLAPGQTDKQVAPTGLYVLAGQTGYLPVALPDGKPVGTITVVTDTLGSLEYELPVAP